MIDFFRHLSLAEQLLADLSFPLVFAILVTGKTAMQADGSVDDKQWQRNAMYVAVAGYIAMITLTIYCHIH